jgi:hypothetical protein
LAVKTSCYAFYKGSRADFCGDKPAFDKLANPFPSQHQDDPTAQERELIKRVKRRLPWLSSSNLADIIPSVLLGLFIRVNGVLRKGTQAFAIFLWISAFEGAITEKDYELATEKPHARKSRHGDGRFRRNLRTFRQLIYALSSLSQSFSSHLFGNLSLLLQRVLQVLVLLLSSSAADSRASVLVQWIVNFAAKLLQSRRTSSVTPQAQ